MRPPIDLVAIARRIRGLIAGADRGDLAATARRLGVDLSALKRSIDLRFPRPSAPFLASVMRAYAIHPLWLLYGTPGHAIAAGKNTERQSRLLLALAKFPRD